MNNALPINSPAAPHPFAFEFRISDFCSRRHFLATAAALAVGAASGAGATDAGTKGVVLYPFDLNLGDWPERCAKAGITTIALHAARRLDVLRDFIAGDAGRAFLKQCEALGISVEYELHAMGELLSRELYYKDPALFRMDAKGVRNVDANCCPH